MPVDEKQFRASKVEAMLARAFEAAQEGDPNEPLPPEVQAEIRAMANMKPEDLEGAEPAEGEEEPVEEEAEFDDEEMDEPLDDEEEEEDEGEYGLGEEDLDEPAPTDGSGTLDNEEEDEMGEPPVFSAVFEMDGECDYDVTCADRPEDEQEWLKANPRSMYRGDNPPGVINPADEGIWDRAKEKIRAEGWDKYREPWAAVMALFARMGGRKKSKK